MSQCQDDHLANFHLGELAVQTQAGVQTEAQQLKKMIRPSLTPAAQKFLGEQAFAVTGSVDAQGRIWTSLLLGQPGFIQVRNPATVAVTPLPIPSDPFYANIGSHAAIGILVIDLTNRRRLRINGQAHRQHDGKIIVKIKETFFNCPKYIQVRHLETDVEKIAAVPKISTRKALLKRNQDWITQADTFFLASYHPKRGADASHRGGFPGFVRVVSAEKLIFPDYAGNNLFQTSGNLRLNPQAGLLFLDFLTGSTLQLVGKAQVIWDIRRVKTIPGAERLVEFDIERVLETQQAVAWRWRFGEYSPANPG